MVKGSWLTAFNLYSAKDRNELPVVGCHLLGTASAFTKLLNLLIDSFLNVEYAVVESLLIINSTATMVARERDRGISNEICSQSHQLYMNDSENVHAGRACTSMSRMHVLALSRLSGQL